MKIFTLFLSAALLTGTIASASAQWLPGIDIQQNWQEQRIHQGMRSGEMTRAEAREVRRLEARVEYLERRANADGFVSRREHTQIAQAERQLDRYIFQAKHNAERRHRYYR